MGELVALVTGAAGGIGEAVVARMLRDGLRVLAVDVEDGGRSKGRSEDPRVRAAQADVRDPAAMAATIQEACAMGTLRVVVANAGVLPERLDGFLSATIEQWRTTLDVNLIGVLNTLQAGARAMVEQGGGGRLIATASGTAIRPEPSVPAYCASKAGVVAVVQSLALELGRHGITVNAVAPGPTLTPGQAEVLRRRADDVSRSAQESDSARFERHRNEGRPIARLGKPEEVAAAIAWLASDEAEYVTGHTLVIDGGAVLV
jgi:NAD(P)-dependent dehydrogenase (short-subunit alcohol dehydrogenase family)